MEFDLVRSLEVVDADPEATARTPVEDVHPAEARRKIPFDDVRPVVRIAEANEEARLAFFVFGM